MKRALAVFSLALWPLRAHAYPISPQTLWDLTGNADLIVVAKVEALHAEVSAPTSFAEAARWKPSPVEDPGFDGMAPLARLRVVETLKGHPANTLDVVTEGGMMCPAPGRFLVGRTVLVFLSGYSGRWHVSGLSYGTLYPDPDELPAFRERVAAALAAQASPQADAHKLDWLVHTAALRATRWHGAYELANGLDPTHAYYDRVRNGGVAKLTSKQRAIIARGFINDPSADSTTAMVAALLKDHADPRLDRALVGAVDALLDGDDSLAAHGAMSAVIARAGADPGRWLGGLEQGAFEYDMEKLRQAWLKARAELRLPPGALVTTRKTVRGVGSDTPP